MVISKTKADAIKKLQTLKVQPTIARTKDLIFVFKYELDGREILSIAIEPETEKYVKGYVMVYVPYPRILNGYDFSSQVRLYQFRSQQAALDAAAQYALKFIQARKSF